MAKKTVTLHMYEYTEEWRAERRHVDEYDMRKSANLMSNRVWIGQTEVEIDFPEVDTRQLQIDALQAEIQRERADSEVRVNLLLERIGKLQCLTCEVAE